MHFVSKKILIKRLKNHLQVHDLSFYPEVSGRVALYRLALAIRESGKTGIALVPDYICNVVHVALEKAGFQWHPYQTDKLLEPDSSEIESLLSSKKGGLLLVASIFGSSAFLENLNEKRIRDLFLLNDIHVIVDLCQDISLIKKVPSGYGKNLSVIVSFNDKSFLGTMGGGILSCLEIPKNERKMTTKQVVSLYKILLHKWCFCFWEKTVSWIQYPLKKVDKMESVFPTPVTFEYSFCRSFPYEIKPLVVSKLQVIMALAGIHTLHLRYMKRKRFARKYSNVIRTMYFDSSPYLLIDGSLHGVQLKRKVKTSYALHHDPERSLHEDFKIIHNKGFCDGK